MFSNIKKYTGLVILAAFFSSCTIDGTNWDVNGLAPVMETTLDWSKMVGDENLEAAPDSALTLHIQDTVYRFELDTLSQINLQEVTNTYLWTYPTLSVPAGTTLPTQTFQVNLDLNDIELTEVIIKEGNILLTIKSAIPRKLKFKYYIPRAIKNGYPFELTDSIDAAPQGDTITYYKVLNASDYAIDLRGINFTTVNLIDIYIDVTLDANSADLTLNTNDFLFSINNRFDNIVPEYGRGYLGQFSFQTGNTNVDLEFLNRIRSGYVDIDQVSLDLTMINHIGADARFKPYFLKAFNDRNGNFMLLSHPAIGNTINLNRATETGISTQPVAPSLYTLHFDNGNSNLDQLVELLPNRLELSVDFYLNPYGNLGGYDDFYYYDYPAMIYMDLTAPLKFAINDIWLVDTLDNFLFDEAQLDHVISGEVKVHAENKFPLEAVLQVYTLDAGGVITDSLVASQTIAAAPVNMNGRVTAPAGSVVNIIATDEKLTHLKEADRLLIKAYFVTLPSAQLMQMYSDYYLKLKLIGDIRYNIEL